MTDQPDDSSQPSTPKGWHERLADEIDRWRKGPTARLLTVVWVLFAGVAAALSFVESYYWAPRRAAEQLRDLAIREGWHDEPRVDVSFLLGDCRIANRDGRPITQVTLSRYLFHVAFEEGCTDSDFWGGGVWGRADTLEPNAHLTTDPSIGPPLLEAARDTASHPCPAGSTCVGLVECRARYLRNADLKPFQASGWAIYDPDSKPPIVPAEYLFSVKGKGELGITWKDPKYEMAFRCLEPALQQRARGEELIRFMSGIGSTLAPEPR